MKLNVLFSSSQVDELYFTGKTSVVIDVLRTATIITTALHSGAREVVPVSSMEFAVKVSSSIFGGQTLLAGERNTLKIQGFNLGNSPSEFSQETVQGKSIILFTTNGSKTIVKAKFSENLFICSFLNLTSVAKKIVELDKDVEIVCAGRNNGFSIEDTVCAGKLIAEIMEQKKDVQLNDASKAGLVLSRSLGDDILKMMLESEHGDLLVKNGMRADVEFCARLNVLDIVPAYFSGSIKIPNLSKQPQ